MGTRGSAEGSSSRRSAAPPPPSALLPLLRSLTEAGPDELRAWHELAFEASPLGIGFVSLDRKILGANPAMGRLLGRDPDDLVGLDLTDITHADDRYLHIDLHLQMLNGDLDHYSLEKRFLRGDGEPVWVRLTVALARNPDGSPRVFVSQCEDLTARRETIARMDLLDQAIQGAAVGLSIQTLQGRFLHVNQALCDLLGRSSEELVGQVSLDFIHASDRPATLELAMQLVTGRIDRYEMETRRDRPDGSTIWVRSTVGVVCDQLGVPTHLLAETHDVTEIRAARRALEAERIRFAALVEHCDDLLLVIDPDGLITYVNPSASRAWGYDPAEIVGERYQDLVHPEEVDEVTSHFRTAMRGPATISFDCRAKDSDGSWRHIEVLMTNHLADPAVGGIVANARDITERVLAAEQITWQAHHDALTGLPNRTLLMQRLDEAISGLHAVVTPPVLLYIDLDGFKDVNDSFGHEAGDMVLAEIGDRLRVALRDVDTCARIGGDEFVVLATNIVDQRSAEALAARIVERLSDAIVLPGGERVVTSASIGIAFANGGDARALLDQADQALYRAKRPTRHRAIDLTHEHS